MKFAEKIVIFVLLALVTLNAEDINSIKKPIKSSQVKSPSAANSVDSFNEPRKIAFFPLTKSNAAVFRAKIKPFTDGDSKIVSFKDSNMLIVMARSGAIKRIQKVFDSVESLELKKVIIVKLKNASVEDVYINIYSISKLLFSDTIPSEKVDVLKNNATNSLIFVGKKKNIDQLLKYLKLLDVKADSNFKRESKTSTTSS